MAVAYLFLLQKYFIRSGSTKMILSLLRMHLKMVCWRLGLSINILWKMWSINYILFVLEKKLTLILFMKIIVFFLVYSLSLITKRCWKSTNNFSPTKKKCSRSRGGDGGWEEGYKRKREFHFLEWNCFWMFHKSIFLMTHYVLTLALN